MNEELFYFNEDASEQLQMMESALLDAMDKGSNSEYIGTIFRAMHTIKGIAGMFNFETIVSFTHRAENLMDAVRNGKIELDETLLMLLLRCKDHVSSLVKSAVDSLVLSSELLKEDVELKSTIENYLHVDTHKRITPQQNRQEINTFSNLWHISLKLKESFFDTGMDLLAIIAFLKKIGTIHNIKPILDHIPVLSEIDPLIPYMDFEIDFEGDVDKAEIVEVFEFVEDDIVLDVTPIQKIEAVSATSIESSTLLHVETPTPKISLEVEPQNEAPVKSLKNISQSLRVDSSKIDSLIDIISEMVIVNAKISRHVEQNFDPDLEEVSLEFDSLLEQLRDSVMNIRMVPVGDSFEKFRRVVNDVAHKLGKKINFTILGGDTELDKTVIEKIADPLIHMLRNAVDHGIEMPQARVQNGKDEFGKVELRTYPESGSIVIEIEDDGKGLSKEFLMEKARSKGIISAMQEMTDAQAYQLIFEPGFSTAEVISDISGRGVGMDVVKKNIEALKGRVELSSIVGEGSCFTIRLPLTLAIIDGFLFRVGKTAYIIPLDMISEVVEYTSKQKIHMLNSNLFDLRGTAVSLLDVRDFYHEQECLECERANIIVVTYANQKMGLLVDELYGEHQTVIKSLGKLFQNAPALYGASILGSGEIALIFDIPALFEIINKESK